MKAFFKKYGIYILAPLLTTLLILVVYLLKGMYPFGSHTIIQADLGQGHVPNCYLMWDIIHGVVGESFSFNLGLGLNVYGQNVIFNPILWLLFFVERSEVIYFMNLLLIIRVGLMAITSLYFFKKTFKNVANYWLVIFSLVYSLGGYTLLTYHNIVWLDCLIVFPLFLLAMKHLFDTGKVLPFVILLTLELVLGYYIAYMILMMIVFCGVFGIHYYVEKKKRKEVAMKLLLGTLISLGLSCFSFLPTFMQSMSSYRIQSMTNGDTGFQEFFTKLNYYLCSAALIVFPILSLMKFKKDQKIKKFLFLSFVFAIAGLILERVNMMWMTGSYMCFPYRYGFIPLMILSIISLHYLNKKEETVSFRVENKITTHDFILGILFTIGAIITIYLIAGFGSYVTTYNIAFGLYSSHVIITILMVSTLFLLLFLCGYCFQNKGLKYITLTIVIIGQILVTSYWYLGIDPAYTSIEHSDTTAKRAEAIREGFKITNSNNLDRYKDSAAYLDENYAHILGVPTISNWIHIVKEEQMVSHQKLGYSTRYTKMQDLGGTLFSDALYHVKYSFHKEKQNDLIYQLLDEHDGIYLYERETLPFGILHNMTTGIDLRNKNSFTIQNQTFRELFEEKEDIIQIPTLEWNVYGATLKEGRYYRNEIGVDAYLETTLSVDQLSALYLDSEMTNQFSEVIVNGKVIDVPVLSYENNTSYPNYNNNGILWLGDYEGPVTIRLSFLSPVSLSEIHIGILDLDQYQNWIEEENTYESILTLGHNQFTLQLHNTTEKHELLIPINYDEGFKATVNGKEVEISRYLGSFMNIPVEDGENEIVFTYSPPYLTLGIQISVVSFILLVVMTFFAHRFKIDQNKTIQHIFFMISIFIYLIFLFVIYIRPYL